MCWGASHLSEYFDLIYVIFGLFSVCYCIIKEQEDHDSHLGL